MQCIPLENRFDDSPAGGLMVKKGKSPFDNSSPLHSLAPLLHFP